MPLVLKKLADRIIKFLKIPREAIATTYGAIAKPLNARWQLHFSDTISRIAIWVTKQDHCLLDLL